MKIKLATVQFLLLFTCLGCSTKRHYTYKIIHTQGRNIVVYGTIYDANTNLPMPVVSILGPDQKKIAQTDKDGKYKAYLTNGKPSLQASWIGYYHNWTKKLKLLPGDSVHVDFWMKEDLRPLID